MASFSPRTFRFLRHLAKHNTKDWFHAHRDAYEAHVRAPALDLVEALAPQLPPSHIAEPRVLGGSLSAPNRDIRFSPDKAPYHTSVRLRFRHHLEGRADVLPAYLLHVEPRRCRAAAGIPRPKRHAADRIRAAIAADPDRWLRATRAVHLADPDLLQHVPDPHAADHTLEAELRRRRFVVEVPLRQADLTATDAVDRVAAAFGTLEPFCRFLEDALLTS